MVLMLTKTLCIHAHKENGINVFYVYLTTLKSMYKCITFVMFIQDKLQTQYCRFLSTYTLEIVDRTHGEPTMLPVQIFCREVFLFKNKELPFQFQFYVEYNHGIPRYVLSLYLPSQMHPVMSVLIFHPDNRPKPL